MQWQQMMLIQILADLFPQNELFYQENFDFTQHAMNMVICLDYLYDFLFMLLLNKDNK